MWTFLLHAENGAPVGRVEMPESEWPGAGLPKILVVNYPHCPQYYAFQNTTVMGWHRYQESHVMIVRDTEIRPAPKPATI